MLGAFRLPEHEVSLEKSTGFAPGALARQERDDDDVSDLDTEATAPKRVQAHNIHEQLRLRICLLDYQPGSMLRENDLAAEFGVSRTPVREALQRLAIEGLVEIRNGVGTFVTLLSPADLHDMYKARIEISALLGRIGLRPCTPADLAEVDRLIVRTEKLKHSFGIREYWDINHQLHFVVSDLITNMAFRDVWDSFYFKSTRVWYGLAQTMTDDATNLLTMEIADLRLAMRENDAEAIGLIKRNYISYSFQRVLRRAAASTS